ncbi:hypothetical protein F9C11_19695 [Amycolatopsis sp. VS8301801F10]|uniref:hypothetical protein n=1 Tax=Amycolatopsis sp. VS8301801F10 TaxID=2652442 RepID=UPI0038FCE6F7
MFRRARPAFLAAAILPAIGGLLGLYRLVAVHPNPFSVFHPILDVVIVPLAISLWRGATRK